MCCVVVWCLLFNVCYCLASLFNVAGCCRCLLLSLLLDGVHCLLLLVACCLVCLVG